MKDSTKIFLIIIAVLAIILFFDKCSEDRADEKYKAEKEKLQKELDSLEAKAEADSLAIKAFETKVEKFSIEKDSLKKEVEIARNERQVIIKEVEKLPKTAIDSIIAENTSTDDKKRETVSKILEYPIIKKENSLLSKELKASDSIIEAISDAAIKKDDLLDTKNKQIKNLKDQVKLCEDQRDKKTSHLFAYGQLNLNGWNEYGAGVDYVIKEKVIVGVNATYDTYVTPNNVNLSVKLGFKIK